MKTTVVIETKHSWWHKFFENIHVDKQTYIEDANGETKRTIQYVCSLPNCKFSKIVQHTFGPKNN